jgi:AP-4 complex subunit sigma-1
MPIKFVLLVNKQGQTRLSKYMTHDEAPELRTSQRRLLAESEIVRRCLRRTDRDCNSIDYGRTRVVYRRYASLFFIVGVDKEENELAVLEWIHCLVETMDKYFGNVCELDVMFSLDVAYGIIEEMVGNGWVIDTNKQSVLAPLKLLERSSDQSS